MYYFDCRSALHRYVLTPVLRNVVDPEAGHKFAVKTLRSGLAPRDPVDDDERLQCEVSLLNPSYENEILNFLRCKAMGSKVVEPSWSCRRIRQGGRGN